MIKLSFRSILWLFLNFCAIVAFSQEGGVDSVPDVKLRKPENKEIFQYSGDMQRQTVGRYLNHTIKALVIDSAGEPVSHFPVYFEKISAPDASSGFRLSDTFVYTDSSGLADTRVKLGNKSGQYEIAAYLEHPGRDHFLLYHFFAREKNWFFFLVAGFIGGLGLFLLGMTMMSEGMRSVAGERMRSVLSHLTHHKLIALGVGALLTTIIQSSSASTVMLVSFVHSKLMKFRQTLGIILGAGIGTTITAQVIAFNLTDYALLMIGMGFLLNFFFQSKKIRYIGRIILGFGILFFGMHVMSESMQPLKSHAPFIHMMLKLERPLIGILAGAVFTALIQSSSAFIGIMITLSLQGLLTLEASVPLILGANIGTSATALLASIKTTSEAQKVAIAHALFKVLVFCSLYGGSRAL